MSRQQLQAVIGRRAGWVLLVASLLHVPSLPAAEVDGFTEPYRAIDIAASESGLLEHVLVQEGDQVRRGAEVAAMTTDLLQATLEIAERSMQAKGQLNSARAELRQKSELLKKLTALHVRNHASQEELDRVAIEREIAEARVLAVEEELQLRNLEYRRIALQIERRKLRTPIDGVVTRVWKEEAEFVAPNDPIVVTVVQLDPLLAVFSIPSSVASQFNRDRAVTLKIAERSVEAKVNTVSPVIDPQSGAVLIKVQFPNSEGKYRSGDRCKLVVPDGLLPRLTEESSKAAPRR